MRAYAISIGMSIVVGLILLFGMTKCVDTANAIEPTTLEDALDRPVKVKKWIDVDNNVVCYWVDRYPKELECIQIRSRGMNSDAR